MKIPWKWLNEYVKLPWEPKEAVKKFTMAGLKVEDLSYQEIPSTGIVSSKILEVKKHPNKPGLAVGTLCVGKENVIIVSGAPGFLKGNTVLVALPGANLPGGHVVDSKDIYGVVSQGMVLSANEILTGSPPRPKEDILVLPGTTSLGLDANKVLQLNDWVIEFELTVNYSHCLSVLGVALEASSLSGEKLILPKILHAWGWDGPEGCKCPETLGSLENDIPFRIELPHKDLCPRYVGKIVKNLSVGYSPVNMERRLFLAGMRPVNSIVDATNYIMLETGQPLHAFDLDRLSPPFIAARKSKTGEELVTLDGVKRLLPDNSVVITDSEKVVGIGGVMGGAQTEVSDDTENILIEAAWFDPLSVRLTSQKLRLRTEAALRFEKRVDPTAQACVAERTAQLISLYSGGTIVPGRAEANYIEPEHKIISLSSKTIRRNLGDQVNICGAKKILESLRFSVKEDGDNKLTVAVPPRRVDIEEEIDLIEELARYEGYDSFPLMHLITVVPGGAPNRKYRWTESLRDFMVRLRGYEGVTSSLLAPEDFTALGWGKDDPRGKPVLLKNPLSSAESCLRTSLLPGLLKSIEVNQKGKVPGIFLWEIGRVFFHSDGELPEESDQIAMAAYGCVDMKSWDREQVVTSYYHMKGIFEALADLLGLRNMSFLPCNSMPFHPKKSARVVVNGSTVGEFGECHPECLKNLDLTAPVSLAWYSLDSLLNQASEKTYTEVSKFMPVERDLAVIVDSQTPTGRILDIVKDTGKNLIEVSLFDIYEKPPVPKGKKSLAMRLIYQSAEKTLTEEELSLDRQRIIKRLEKEAGARLRL